MHELTEFFFFSFFSLSGGYTYISTSHFLSPRAAVADNAPTEVPEAARECHVYNC